MINHTGSTAHIPPFPLHPHSPCCCLQGEAEALCAALNACGLVHAVLGPDVDALLFGATMVYKTLKLQAANTAAAEMEVRCCRAGHCRGSTGQGLCVLVACFAHSSRQHPLDYPQQAELARL